MKNIENRKGNIDTSQLIENFFNIWILKEFIYDKRFQIYYKTFIGKNGKYDEEKLKEKLKDIFCFISTYNATTDRPNNISSFSDEKIKHIILKYGEEYECGWAYSNDILTQIEGGLISMENETDFSNLNNGLISSIRLGLSDYLNKLYDNGIYNLDVELTIDQIVEMIVDIIKNDM